MESDKLTGKLARWALMLMEYDFKVVHRAGLVNMDAHTNTQLEKQKKNKTAEMAEMRENCTLIGVFGAILLFLAGGSMFLVFLKCKKLHLLGRKQAVVFMDSEISDYQLYDASLVNQKYMIPVKSFGGSLKALTYSDLLQATDNFSSAKIIGDGGFGMVYKAKLGDGTVVAIKKLVQDGAQGEREFRAEMETLGLIRVMSSQSSSSRRSLRDEEPLKLRRRQELPNNRSLVIVSEIEPTYEDHLEGVFVEWFHNETTEIHAWSEVEGLGHYLWLQGLFNHLPPK